MSDTRDVPVLEVLDSIPLNGRAVWMVSSIESRNIPYGNICQQAAMRIRQLERELAEVTARARTAEAMIQMSEHQLGNADVVGQGTLIDKIANVMRAGRNQHEEMLDLARQLTAHKAALNLCQMALNADNHETYLELKFEALSEIAKLKGTK